MPVSHKSPTQVQLQTALEACENGAVLAVKTYPFITRMDTPRWTMFPCKSHPVKRSLLWVRTALEKAR